MIRQIAAARLAERLLDNAERLDPGVTQRLQDDPWLTIRSDASVQVRVVELVETESECSIAGLYRSGAVPPEILVAHSASPGRRSFSLLHEWGHHRINQDDEVAEELYSYKEEEGRELEENVCDALAARLLLPADVVRDVVGDGSVSAYTFARLCEQSSASREACAVRLSQELASPGYVVVARLDPSSGRCRVQFAAAAGDALPIRRNTPQPGTLLEKAFTTGHATGRESLRFPSGAQTAEMYGETLRRSEYVLGVFVQDRPSWGDFALRPRPARGGFEEQYCEECAAPFYPSGSRCRVCGDFPCTTCNRCTCEPRSAQREKDCPACFQRLPLRLFPDGDVCSSCS